MQSPHTLVQTPGTAGREGLAGQARARARITTAAPGGADRVGGVVLGRYSLRERLGAGGFGVVWRARDELLGREVALKRIALPDGQSERASREALAAARLSHPAIVALYEACAAPDAFYLISELVRGQTLAQLIAARELEDWRVLQIGIALADALAHAHARGVIHRDVKPQNVLVPHEREQEPLTARGSPAVAKLTDFGGARLAGDDVLTRTGDVLGTLAYMAPEQSDGGEVGEAADLYSLALILYEALCGVNPVRGPTPAATARRIGRPLEPLERSRGDLPRALTRALDRALAPAERDRGTLDELRGALAGALRQLGDAPPRAARRRILRRPLPPAAAPEASQLTPPARAAGGELLDTPPGWEPNPAQRALPARRRPRARETALPACEQPAVPLRRARRAPERVPQETPQAAAGEQSHEEPRALPGVPRALWIGAAALVIAWQAWSGRPGVAVMMLAALAPVAALCSERAPRRERPRGRGVGGPGLLAGVLAPVLGLAGLAGAYPAIAGQASRWRMRAALGALGYWWLVLSEPLLARRLWLGPPSGTPPRAAWEASVGSAAVHVVGPMLSFGVLLGALLWAVGAACLPWIVRGRRAAFDVVAVTMWSAAMATAAPMLGRGLSAGAHTSPRGAVLGAVLGACVAVAARALRGPV